MANGSEGTTLRFTCDACGTHLGVDDSLAGMEAPCPKCGAVLVAPDPRSRGGGGGQVPAAGVVRGISGGRGFQVATREREESLQRRSDGSSSGRSRSRRVSPSVGGTQNERDNLRVLIKILVATALVVLIVVLVTWLLRNQ